MSTIEHALPVEVHHALRGFRYLLDSLLACAESLLVDQVLTNLLENAVRYTTRG